MATNGKMHERFTQIKDDRPMWSAEAAAKNKAVLCGHLLGLLDMPPTDNGPWRAFVVRVTEETIGLNADETEVTVKPGDEILLPATTKLLQRFTAAAINPKFVFEIFVQPTEKVKTNTPGRKMWKYVYGADMKNPLPRTSENTLIDGLREAPKMLGRGQSDEDVPGFGG